VIVSLPSWCQWSRDSPQLVKYAARGSLCWSRVYRKPGAPKTSGSHSPKAPLPEASGQTGRKRSANRFSKASAGLVRHAGGSGDRRERSPSSEHPAAQRAASAASRQGISEFLVACSRRKWRRARGHNAPGTSMAIEIQTHSHPEEPLGGAIYPRVEVGLLKPDR